MAWIEIEEETCEFCREKKRDTLAADWTAGEYGISYLCQDCIIKTFKESGFVVVITKEK